MESKVNTQVMPETQTSVVGKLAPPLLGQPIGGGAEDVEEAVQPLPILVIKGFQDGPEGESQAEEQNGALLSVLLGAAQEGYGVTDETGEMRGGEAANSLHDVDQGGQAEQA